ncbi:response regulator transcription factor [Candidatus Gracilibacteria bacterium]|nr:response regulator transcription factor [Candidatus Gracilibacteria bacterium]
MKKILLIEDNKEISDSIKQYLELEDFSVKQIFRGDDGLDEALVGTYDLILLDVMLPGVDGFRIAEKLSRKIETPILMITAKDSIDDKLEGFDKGVVDYIVKPFDLRELEARIGVILSKNGTKNIFEFKNISIDIEHRTFTKDNDEIKITQKEFLILDYLLNNKGNPIARTDIIEHLWGGDSLFEGDGKLDVYISNLRKKFDKELIETIKGFGYKIK